MANTTNYDLNLFLKKNKKPKENLKLVVTKELTDKDGNPAIWEFRMLTTKEINMLKEKHTKTNKKGVSEFNHEKFSADVIASSCVIPNLNDVTLQENYGVIGAENLLYEIVDNPGEYGTLQQNILKYFGYLDGDIEGEIKEAKN